MTNTSPGAKLGAVGAGQRLDATPSGPLHPLPARRAVGAAGQPERRDVAARRRRSPPSSARRKRMRRRAPSPPRQLPGAARAAADGELLQDHRDSAVPAPRGRSCGCWSCGSAPRWCRRSPGPAPVPPQIGFVVLAGGVAEQEVVHRRLAAGHGAERAEQRVAGRLADLGVAGHHRRARRWARGRCRAGCGWSIGFRQPSFSGMSSPTRQRNT